MNFLTGAALLALARSIFVNSSWNGYELTIFGWKNTLFHGGNLDKDCTMTIIYLKMPAFLSWSKDIHGKLKELKVSA